MKTSESISGGRGSIDLRWTIHLLCFRSHGIYADEAALESKFFFQGSGVLFSEAR